MGEYDGTGDLDEHMHLLNDRLNYFSVDDPSKCNLFALTLTEPANLWLNGLLEDNVTS